MASQTNTFLPLLPLVPKDSSTLPPSTPGRTTTSSTLASITTTTAPSLSSSPSSTLSSPSPISTTIAYAIKRLIAPSSSANDQAPQTLGLFTTLDQANNTVYSLRLAYETCDPCFFWYGDGHGSPHPEISGAAANITKQKGQSQGEFLSWEVFPDEDGKGDEVGCRVWVERIELNPWDAIADKIDGQTEEVAFDSVKFGGVKTKVGHWRDALEPIARPCNFWGTFTVK